MSSLAQLSADDTQRSPLVAQFLAQHGVGSKRAPTIGELRQLRTELGRLSDKAAAWAAQLERGQPLPGPSNSNSSTATATATASGSSGAAGSAAGPGGKRHAAGDDSPETAHSAEGPKPGAIGAESKRAKHSHLASRGGGSDSDGSNNPSSARSSSHGIGGAAANGDGSGASQKDSAGMPVAASAKAKHSAGAPVQDDFSRVKVTNQVQIQTYWAAMEPYFRHVTDEDIVFLESAADNQEDYTIPKLGKFYAHQWAEEEVAHFPDHLHNSKTRYIAQSLL
ncbi:Transcriptional regulator, partial [Coemansia spiralis]